MFCSIKVKTGSFSRKTTMTWPHFYFYLLVSYKNEKKNIIWKCLEDAATSFDTQKILYCKYFMIIMEIVKWVCETFFPTTAYPTLCQVPLSWDNQHKYTSPVCSLNGRVDQCMCVLTKFQWRFRVVIATLLFLFQHGTKIHSLHCLVSEKPECFSEKRQDKEKTV